MKRSDLAWKELREHLPFTLLISLFAGILVAVLYNFGRVPSEELFEFLHPAHVWVSAVATSAIYWRYNKNYLRAILIGVVGAILIGTISDVLLPFLAGNLFSLHTHFHLPILEKPLLILGLALIGAVVGMYWDLFCASHLLHVFLSVFASLFYLLAFSASLNVWGVLGISGLVFLCVYIPCCISDIIFPILFIDKACEGCGRFH